MLARDRLEDPGRVGHHIADDLDPAGDAFTGEHVARPLVRAEEQLRALVCLDPVPLLGHGEVTAAETCLDVGERQAELLRGERPRQRRVRVAVDQHPVGLLGAEALHDRRSHHVRVGRAQVEPVLRLREPELLEKHL